MAGYASYGPWVPSAGASKRMRLKFEWNVATPQPGASTVAVTLTVSVQAGNWFWDGQARYTRSGAMGSSDRTIRIDVRPSGGSTIIERVTKDLPIYSTGAYMIAAAASLSGVDYIGSGVTASHTSSIPLPGQSSGMPGRPAPTASYVSDDRATISWGATDLAERYYVERWDEANQRWDKLGVVYGTSVTDWGLSPNNRYKWRVCASNGGLESAWAETGGIRTTPNAPGLSVTREGQQIVATVMSSANYPQHWYLERSIDGGSWQYWTQDDGRDGKASMTPGPGQTVRIRARSGVSEGGQRWSQWTTSDVVLALTPPNPPTLVSPVGVASVDSAIPLVWRHNPRDLTAQTAAEVQWQAVGDQSWATQQISGPDEIYNVWLVRGRWNWRARTKGLHSDWGGWSNPQGFRAAAPPRVTIDNPTPGQVLDTNRLSVSYTASDPEGEAIVSWQAQLEDRTDSKRTEWSGEGNPGVVTAPAILLDGHSYEVRLRILSGSGLWSDWATVAFNVDYAEPAQPLVVARFIEVEGVVTIDVTAQKGDIDTESMRVEVSRDRGATWQLLAQIPAPHGVVTDPIPRLGSDMPYRVTAVSSLPSESPPVEVTVDTMTDRLWLNPDGGVPLYAIGDLSIQPEVKQETKLEHYLGASYPTPHWGEARTATIKLSFRTCPGVGSEEELWLALLGRRITYRDPESRVYRTVLDGELSQQQTRRSFKAWSLTLAVIDD